MSRVATHLLQIQLSEDERRRLKSLAASRGMNVRQAVLAALDAWEEKLAQPSRPHQTSADTKSDWLQHAAKLDWTRCPEVEILTGKDRRFWVVQGTLAPLSEVLQSVHDGNPLEEVAEVFQVPLPRLASLLKFAGCPSPK